MFRICSRRLAHAVAKADSHATIPGLSADSNVVKHQGITAIAEDKHGHTGRVAIYVKAGPAYESKWNAGASQWLRHFGRKDGIVYSQFGFETALEEACVHLNNVELAGREYLVYSVEGNRDTLVQPELFDILWSNILFPKFHPFHINQARKYVQQDSADVQHHNPRRYLLDQVYATAYKGSALANSEFCPSYNIKGIKDDTLWDFWEQQYTFDNISLVATNVDPHHVMDSAFGALWFQRAHVRRGAGKEASAKYSGGENQVIHHRASDYDEQFNDVYNTYTALAFKAPTTGKHSTATKIVAEVLRSHVQSRVGGHGGQVFVADGLVGVIVANATTEKLNAIIDAVRNAPRDVDKAVPSLLVREAFRGDLRARTQQIFEASRSADSPTPATSKEIAGEVQSVVSGIFAAKPTLVHYGSSKAPPALDSLKF